MCCERGGCSYEGEEGEVLGPDHLRHFILTTRQRALKPGIDAEAALYLGSRVHLPKAHKFNLTAA